MTIADRPQRADPAARLERRLSRSGECALAWLAPLPWSSCSSNGWLARSRIGPLRLSSAPKASIRRLAITSPLCSASGVWIRHWRSCLPRVVPRPMAWDLRAEHKKAPPMGVLQQSSWTRDESFRSSVGFARLHPGTGHVQQLPRFQLFRGAGLTFHAGHGGSGFLKIGFSRTAVNRAAELGAVDETTCLVSLRDGG